jgi:protein TonB
MTARVSTWFEDENPDDIRRWAIAAAIVIAIHLAAFAAYVYGHRADDIGDDTAPISVDLAPSDDTVDQAEVAPTPEQPPQVEQPQPPPPPPEPPQAVVAPEPPPPQKIEEQPPPTPAMQARTKGGMERDEASWRSRLSKHLLKFKRYPNEAQSHGEEGTVTLSFTVDRTGHVLARKIVQSSGYPPLDAEVLSMIDRAQPLPAFPDTMTDSQIDLIVPVQFSLR